MFTSILKRDGRVAPYDISKIQRAVNKAMEAAGRVDPGHEESLRLAHMVETKLSEQFGNQAPSVEEIQDAVEASLMEAGYAFVARKYILYRAERTKVREMNSPLMRIYDELTFADAQDSDMKRENANIDGNTPMGTMLRYGQEGAKSYYEKCILTAEQSRAHRSGDIHINDFDFYTLTTTCCQIDINQLFHGGFSTGHGYLREPNSIQSYTALACIAIQANQNDQHGGQSIPNFDYGLAPGIKKTYRTIYHANLAKALELVGGRSVTKEEAASFVGEAAEKAGSGPALVSEDAFKAAVREVITQHLGNAEDAEKIVSFTERTTERETERQAYQAMEALVHNLNTMHSRCGAQVPFSSINYGLDTSPEGRMIIRNVLLATEAGLGNGETPIFPIHIFRVKEGISYNPGDPNYDLFKLACRVSAKRLFPNFSFIDAPFNLPYYKPGHPESEIAYMGCRTRVMGNVYDDSREITFGRGNLSFTAINLPRIGIKSQGNLEWFFEELERKMELVTKQLLDRFAIQSKKRVRNFPFLMGQGVWIDSDKLGPDDEVGEVLRHGSLSVGFIGLAETLVALRGQHHGQSEESRILGLEIIGFMRDYLDRLSREKKLNFTLLASPAEGLSGRFVKIDRQKFGEIPGVTDREYYTNSFHVPVYFPISAYEKIQIEAPYHALTNAGHITYVELDGDTTNNIEAFESVVRAMKEAGVGYGSINHPVDRDPACGYTGVIGDTCPKCGRSEEDHARFDRIRRITGYLVGTLDQFNNAKRAEERDRVKHGAQ